ncbi:hypothetical protein GCM10008995_18330 [Halobellus salinus]|uniref:DUF7322 domain-containing protein n=1 Tax=Halobellus salinus TaxID=931585 RepID=A0A830ER31_9EURY|nr:hypothetical protein [Halobellus salinus]GGJ08818.1 hypothetical protein GCM10008995_18330 [Halobellus salinus]SMP26918.1 hypothetical protein SAMN06265347_1125 [Halobellus salinus]
MPPESDKWPDEPDEPDPESRWGDPEDDLVSVPSVESPALDPGAEGAGIEIDGELARLFWAAVVYANIALGGVSIGLLLVLFRGQVTVGGAGIAVGLVALYRTYDLYRTHQERVVEGDGTGGGSGEDDRGVDGGRETNHLTSDGRNQ